MNQNFRKHHAELENKIDVIFQDESLFKIDPDSYLVSYNEDSKIEEQGFKIRIDLTDDLLSLKGRLVEFLGSPDFTIIEVERLRTGYC